MSLLESTTSSLLLPYNQPLEKGTFLKRYNRFLVDVKRTDGRIETIHCANTGSMKSCLQEGAPVYTLPSNNPQRLLKSSLELMELEDGYVCVNTMRANQVVEAWLKSEEGRMALGCTPSPYPPLLKREALYEEGTRFDFLLQWTNAWKEEHQTWVEVKSVSMRQEQPEGEPYWAFPDAVTLRGQKHLHALATAGQTKRHNAWLIFVMMRGSQHPPALLRSRFRIAAEIDPVYHQTLKSYLEQRKLRIGLLVPSLSLEGFGLREFYKLPLSTLTDL